MNIALLIITAITIEKLTQNEVAQRYGVSQSWVAARSLGNRAGPEPGFIGRSEGKLPLIRIEWP
jgi:transcriptional regulator with XRE-family HTH domain